MTTNLYQSFTEQRPSSLWCVLIPYLHWCAQKLGKTQCACKGMESEISPWQKTDPLFSILGSLFMDSSDCQLIHSLSYCHTLHFHITMGHHPPSLPDSFWLAILEHSMTISAHNRNSQFQLSVTLFKSFFLFIYFLLSLLVDSGWLLLLLIIKFPVLQA